VVKGETAPAHAALSVAGFAALLIVGVWSTPAAGSIGVTGGRCDESRAPLETAHIAVSASLAAHTESALKDILDDDIPLPTLASTNAEPSVDQVDDVETVENRLGQSSDSPRIAIRLPGVSEATMPSFRRQMYRTDI